MSDIAWAIAGVRLARGGLCAASECAKARAASWQSAAEAEGLAG